jgi:glucan phosphoethanolaminetransferase (alkaline phosphatase superfamily)
MRKAALYGTGVAILNVMANLAHTASHLGQHVVSLPSWQLAYVILVIFIVPIAAAVLLWTRYRGVSMRRNELSLLRTIIATNVLRFRRHRTTFATTSVEVPEYYPHPPKLSQAILAAVRRAPARVFVGLRT